MFNFEMVLASYSYRPYMPMVWYAPVKKRPPECDRTCSTLIYVRFRPFYRVSLCFVFWRCSKNIASLKKNLTGSIALKSNIKTIFDSNH